MENRLMIIVVVLILGVLYSIYVSLIKKRNKVKEAAASIEVQLKKRYDLIPNLLNMAAKFMTHEKALMEEIVRLRNKAAEQNFAGNPSTSMALDNELNQKLKDFWISVENYHDLKSNQTMLEAMQSFNEVEEHIAAARRFYNAAVNDLKNAVEIFPGSLIASMLGITADMPYFEAEEKAKERIDAQAFFK